MIQTYSIVRHWPYTIHSVDELLENCLYTNFVAKVEKENNGYFFESGDSTYSVQSKIEIFLRQENVIKLLRRPWYVESIVISWFIHYRCRFKSVSIIMLTAPIVQSVYDSSECTLQWTKSQVLKTAQNRKMRKSLRDGVVKFFLSNWRKWTSQYSCTIE